MVRRTGSACANACTPSGLTIPPRARARTPAAGLPPSSVRGQLELLWVLEGTLALERDGAELLDEVCASTLFTADELPTPSAAERKPPRAAPGDQADLL